MSDRPISNSRRFAALLAANRLVLILGIMLVVLVGGIAASAALFIQREAIVGHITRSGSENFTWAFNQLRVEYYRLIVDAERVMLLHGNSDLAAGQATDWQAKLRQRFELFASRVNIVGQGVYHKDMSQDALYAKAMLATRAFVAEIDRELAGSPDFTVTALRLVNRLDPELALALDRLTARAVEVDSARLGTLRDDLLELRTYEFANLALKLCMLLGFGTVSILGLVRLDRQKRHLEVVADDLKEARTKAEVAGIAERHALTRALEEEQRNSRLQRRFVSMASHEFRTPLAIIDSAAQRLLRKLDRLSTTELAERIQAIRHTVARLGELIETMLEAGRVGEGRVQFSPLAFDLEELLHRVAKQQRDISPHHQIVEDIDTLPPDFLGDQRLVTQILVNLLSNAIKYSPAGGEVRVSARIHQSMVEIAVTDQGVGIPEDELTNLFDLFYRASTSAGIPGTGLGLDLVRKFVTMHNGTITVTSKVGSGSTFTVRLPFRTSVIPSKNLPVELAS
jgi:signal transduction histidine kinase